MKKKIPFTLVCLLCILCIRCTKPETQKQPPNVLFISIDDLRTELGAYGKTYVKSPNIDRIASEGAVFDHHYVQVPTCGASRYALMTGMRPSKLAHLKNSAIETEISNKPEGANPESFIHHFRRNGYHTVGIGKITHSADGLLYGYEEPVSKKKELPHSWDELLFDSGKWKTGWNAFFAYANGENRQSLKKQVKPYEVGEVTDEGYPDGLTTNLALSKLKELKKQKQPFFMGVGFFKPHLPFNAPKKYWDLYSKNDFEIPVRDKPKDMYRLALAKWGELKSYSNIPTEGDLNDDLTRDLIHGYHASVSYIDAQIGKVMATLKELDLRKNTMIIFMSDHGYKIGEYGAWCKQSNVEIDVRVPLIISRETAYKNRVTDKTSDALVENVDIFQTLVDICDLKSAPASDGKSILPVLNNPKTKWDDAAYSVYARGKKIMGVTTTDGQWRYTEWRNSATHEILGAELYEHKNSLLSFENLSGQSKYKKVEDRMRTLLEVQFPRVKPFLQNDQPRR